MSDKSLKALADEQFRLRTAFERQRTSFRALLTGLLTLSILGITLGAYSDDDKKGLREQIKQLQGRVETLGLTAPWVQERRVEKGDTWYLTYPDGRHVGKGFCGFVTIACNDYSGSGSVRFLHYQVRVPLKEPRPGRSVPRWRSIGHTDHENGLKELVDGGAEDGKLSIKCKDGPATLRVTVQPFHPGGESARTPLKPQ